VTFSRSAHPSRAAALAAPTLLACALVGLSTGPAGATPAVPGHAGNPSTTYTVQDLGTLGGTTSRATALDAGTVVGESGTAGGDTHAFAYDRRTGRLTDLGSLGGTSSTAIAVRGRYVVGNSTTPGDAATHGFVYDLRRHAMTDIGTLGGATSTITALGGTTAVGSASTAGDAATHAFAYDLRTGVMTDLGSLAGPSGSSAAVGIAQDRYVVGDSSVPGGPASATHGFVHDLRTGVTTDIGTGGGAYSTISDVSGRTVVGTFGVTTAGGSTRPHGFAYDLSTGTWTDIGGTLFLDLLVSGHHVVGWDGQVAWAYDLGSGVLSQVGTRGVSQPTDIRGSVAVGDEFAVNSFAFVYRTDSAAFVRLAALGGLNSGAAAVDARGAVAGAAATAPPDPYTANGPFHAALWTPSCPALAGR
jgi:probable HAF family extracellular repeat protein